jgi:hypothetical protein
MRWLTKSFVRKASFVAAAGAVAVFAVQQFGCSSGSHTTAVNGGPPSGADPTGAVGMTLTIPGGEMVSSIGWVITGPTGASTVVQQGTVNVQSSASINFLVSGIPSGSGYTVSLSGTTTDGAFACAGSATFAVTARTTTNVTASVFCAVRAQDAGSVNVGGQLYACATVNGISAMPSETTVGGSVALSATASAPNGGTITYAWSAPSGTFSAPTAANTGFTCTASGAVTVTVTVGDGPVPDGSTCNPANSTFTAQVQCDAAGQSVCSLGPGGAIKHVIYVQFDNTHLSQDVPSVASDLQQMPHLLGFIRGNGTMMANDHTILISHTGGGILSTLTGMYPDRTGQTVSNSYVRTSATGAFSFPSTFQYWSDTVATNVYNLTQPDGTNVPAPWLPYTRSGCNFGAVALADMELESVSTSAFGDVATVFGTSSPQFQEAKTNSSKAVTDLEGVAVHCAQGSSVCASGEVDFLPATQNYNGFRGLFGTQQIDPVLTGSDAGVALTDLLGNPIQDINGNPGFPGFNGMTPAVSLAYVAAMQENGIPVTFAYISDAHDNHGVDGNGQAAFGPGQPGYEQQLANYDQAFANFFTRLAADGINQSNTLFVFTVDEGDHFVGVAPSPPTCDGGAGNTCNYPDPGDAGTGLGEINVNIDLLLSSEQPGLAQSFVMGNRTNPGAPYDFTVHGDDAPTFYLSRVVAGDAGQATGPLAQGDPMTRQFERAAGSFTILNPYTFHTDSLLFRMADQTGMQAIHMMAASDPVRNPTFVYFADDDYFVTDFPTTTCADCANSAFAWNHGDDQSVIGQTWVGFVGPGVTSEDNGPDQTIWTDHTDVRPTMLSILGLQDGYIHDGRVITQALQPAGYSPNLASNLTTVQTLGDAYKQINSPFDVFGQCVLTVSTAALQADDTTYASFESSIAALTSQRDTLATAIKNALDGAEFGATPVATADASNWITQAQNLISACAALQGSIPPSSGGAIDAGADGN